MTARTRRTTVRSLRTARRYALNRYHVAIIGATGAVGRELISVLEERSFPCKTVRLAASERSSGETLKVKGQNVMVENLAAFDPQGIDVAFFSAGKERSGSFGPAFTRAGAWVIDNSSAFRMDPAVPLVVPEINGGLLREGAAGLIANPNCSTIIALLPLAALHAAFGTERILVSTYQAVSGAGGEALEELARQTARAAEGLAPEHRILKRPILHNLIPWIGEEDASGFCEEERKMALESRKILDAPGLKISATTVRVAVKRCHSMAIWVRLSRTAGRDAIRSVLSDAPGVLVHDVPPCPAEVEGTDAVHVGRLRMDPDEPKACWFWVVSDQLRKGAALNAVQIAEKLHGYGKIS